MEGPQAVLGTFWLWLAGLEDKPAYGALSTSVAAHAFENYPFAAGAKVLGRTLEHRRWHSLRSASLEAGLSTNEIRRLLTGTGLLPDEGGRGDTLVLFDADRAAPLLSQRRETLYLPDIAVRLGVTRASVVRLAQDGLLGAGTQSGARNLRFARFELADVDRLVDRLFDGAEEMHESHAGTLGLAACATRLRFARADVLRLALDDRTLWRGRLAGREGVCALLLRPDDVEARLSPKPGDLLDVVALARRLAENSNAAYSLVQKDVIQSHVLPRPRFGRPPRVVKGPDAEVFASQYASLSMLALETGRPVACIRREIAMAGITPAFPVEELRVALYRRSDLPDAAASDHPDQARSGMSSKDVTRALRVDARVAAGILDARLIPSWTASSSNSRKTMRLVLEADLDAFVGEYAPLTTLARERSTNVASMHSRLECAGVAPVLTTHGAFDPVYRRRDVPVDVALPRKEPMPPSNAKGKKGKGSGEGTAKALPSQCPTAAREVPSALPGAAMREVAGADPDGCASLATIACECDRSMDAVAAWLGSEGVEPVLPGDAREGPIYLRADVPASPAGMDATASVISVQATGRRLGMERKVIRGLIRCGAIPLRETARSVRGTPVNAVLRRDVDAFDAQFVGLGALARERALTMHETHVWLELCGVQAAFPVEVCKALIYRRADLPPEGPDETSDPPLNIVDVTRLLGTTHAVIAGLLVAGTLRSKLVVGPSSRSPHRIVTTSALRAFTDAYASLRMLARETGASRYEIRFKLAAHGVEPAFTQEELPIQLYRRSEIAIRGALDGPVPAAVTPQTMARELGMDVRSVLAIVRAGLIPSRPMSRPASGKPSRLVTREDLDRFKAEYVTAGMLAKERGRSAPNLGGQLSALGIEPIIRGSARIAAVYRRQDLPLSDRRLA